MSLEVTALLMLLDELFLLDDAYLYTVLFSPKISLDYPLSKSSVSVIKEFLWMIIPKLKSCF